MKGFAKKYLELAPEKLFFKDSDCCFFSKYELVFGVSTFHSEITAVYNIRTSTSKKEALIFSCSLNVRSRNVEGFYNSLKLFDGLLHDDVKFYMNET